MSFTSNEFAVDIAHINTGSINQKDTDLIVISLDPKAIQAKGGLRLSIFNQGYAIVNRRSQTKVSTRTRRYIPTIACKSGITILTIGNVKVLIFPIEEIIKDNPANIKAK
ncbi:unnamed protein product [marine sediment metagenome]|uniref:Uncharacterized protein n=1 Tax=marine sediment metagenome TaxID=412755 RepID=X1M612_9ZZZZ